MLALVLFIVFGLVFGYFSTLNTSLSSVYFGPGAVKNVPMYIIVLASFGIGVVFTAIFNALRSISSGIAWSKKEKELADSKEEAVLLTKRIHELEIDIAKLKTKHGEKEIDEDSL
jgi:uncharacterized integral membrane protein